MEHSLRIDEKSDSYLDGEIALVDVNADNLERKREELVELLRAVTEELEAFQERFCRLLYTSWLGGPAN